MIWILSSAFGDGHNSAARSVAEALRRQEPSESVVVTDLISQVHPLLGYIFQQAYQLAIIHTPSVWKAAYDWMASSDVVTRESELLRPQLMYVTDFICRYQPRIIISTYPSYSSLVQMLRDDGVAVPPLLTIITDSITVHPVWLAAPSDAYAVADTETKASLSSAGVPEQKIHVTGFPVSHRYASQTQRPAQAQLLYMPSTAQAHVMQTLDQLLPQLQAGVGLTILAGKHLRRLHHALRKWVDSHPQLDVRCLGWSDQVAELLMSHHALITKAGGAILHEALAAQIPVIIDYVVPGQEEGNAEYVTTHGCGIRSTSPRATAAAVEQLFQPNSTKLEEVRVRLIQHSRADAALRIAALATSLGQSSPKSP